MSNLDNDYIVRERVAKLEEMAIQGKEDRRKTDEKLDDTNQKIADLEKKVDALIAKLSRYEGRLGTMWWVLSVLGMGLVYFKDEIKGLIRYFFGG